MEKPAPPDGSRADLIEEVLAEYIHRADRGEAVERERFQGGRSEEARRRPGGGLPLPPELPPGAHNG
jgi:hypothetical protein